MPLARSPEGVAEAEAAWADFAQPDSVPPAPLEQFQRERRRYAAGLTHDLSTDDVALVEQAREDSLRLFHALAGAEPDDVPALVSEVIG